MTQLREGQLCFEFTGADASHYDQWSFYRNQFSNAFGGAKAVDFIYVDEQQVWLIEVKDYRANRRTKPSDLGDEIAFKVRDTLAGLVAAKSNANQTDECVFAKKALRKTRIRIVLHLEQPRKPSKLFPQAVDPAKLLIKLKQKLKSIDPHPAIVDRHALQPQMNWTVTG